MVVQAGLVEANKNDTKLWQAFATIAKSQGTWIKPNSDTRAALLWNKETESADFRMYRRDGLRARQAAIFDEPLRSRQWLSRPAQGFQPWRELAGYLEKDGQIDQAATAYGRAHSRLAAQTRTATSSS